MKKILLLLVLIMAILPITSNGQNKAKKQYTVSGAVVDETGESMPGTSVFIKNMPGVGTTTDLEGKFRIKVDANATLVIQAIGMKPVEMLINKDMDKLKIVLKEDSELLDEVVITGLTSQKKISIVGAVSNIEMSQLSSPATSINNMLGGRLAGVITMQTSGEPGSNISNFWIRGISTFGAGSGALVLIDGLEGKLSDIDPDDVESFSILKDASATAVYGVRGANGVVLVTTKRGGSGKLEITGRATLQISRIKRLPEYLGAFDYAKL
ncbi:MAG: TonB-dependent receptor plug domain-containing protein, partial [Bacteroides sp.]